MRHEVFFFFILLVDICARTSHTITHDTIWRFPFSTSLLFFSFVSSSIPIIPKYCTHAIFVSLFVSSSSHIRFSFFFISSIRNFIFLFCKKFSHKRIALMKPTETFRKFIGDSKANNTREKIFVAREAKNAGGTCKIRIKVMRLLLWFLFHSSSSFFLMWKNNANVSTNMKERQKIIGKFVFTTAWLLTTEARIWFYSFASPVRHSKAGKRDRKSTKFIWRKLNEAANENERSFAVSLGIIFYHFWSLTDEWEKDKKLILNSKRSWCLHFDFFC